MRVTKQVLIILCGLLTSCEKVGFYSQSDIDERDDEIASLHSQLQTAKENADELSNRLEELESASSELQDNVSRLRYENWQDVMPDVEYSSQEVESASDEATSAADDLSSTLDD